LFRPCKVRDICNSCGGTEFKRRADDSEETVRTRLSAYHSQTSPLEAWYEDQGLLRRIDGNHTIDQVGEAISNLLI
ncbi:MAG: adenylate kinase, partial [Candidatus Thermoplasmatota archaeon]|nr:adenylate kinase [Candidatus Thermoplasmatota archaeon]